MGIVLLGTVFSGERSFEEAALGSLTVVHEGAGPNGENSHCQRIKEEDHAAAIAFAEGNKSNILILGNSQTHSINQKKGGETVYPELIQQQLDGIGVLTHSMPNANFQEFLISHAWWTQHTAIDRVAVPAFMDDLREDGLRGDFLRMPVTSGFQLLSEQPLEQSLNKQLNLLTNPPSEAGSEYCSSVAQLLSILRSARFSQSCSQEATCESQLLESPLCLPRTRTCTFAWSDGYQVKYRRHART